MLTQELLDAQKQAENTTEISVNYLYDILAYERKKICDATDRRLNEDDAQLLSERDHKIDVLQRAIRAFLND